MNQKTKPFHHQQEAFELSRDREVFALFMEQGTGKSKVIIDTAAHLYLEGKIDALIVAAPKGVYLNWQRDELPKHMSEDIVYGIQSWVAPSRQGIEKERVLRSFSENKLPYLKVLLVNIEGFSHDNLPKYLREFLRCNKCLFAIDESSTIRVASSKRALSARRLGPLATYRRLLTGTPMAESPLDLFAQMAFLDPDILGFNSFQLFKLYYADIQKINLHAHSPGRPPKLVPQILGYRRLDELSKSLAPVSYRVTKDECLDLPSKIYTVRYVEATAEQKRIYNQMAQTFVAQVGEEYATAPIALTKILRLQGILCGHLRTDDGVLQEVPSNRITALLDTIQETHGQIIIWALYKPDIKAIASALRAEYGFDSVAEFHGGIDDQGRALSMDAFRSGKSRFFLATAATAAMGITLVEANTVIYYNQNNRLEHRQQSEDRAHRIGQTQHVQYIDLLVAGTVDEDIVNAVKAKEQLSKEVLAHLPHYFRPLA